MMERHSAVLANHLLCVLLELSHSLVVLGLPAQLFAYMCACSKMADERVRVYLFICVSASNCLSESTHVLANSLTDATKSARRTESAIGKRSAWWDLNKSTRMRLFFFTALILLVLLDPVQRLSENKNTPHALNASSVIQQAKKWDGRRVTRVKVSALNTWQLPHSGNWHFTVFPLLP